MNRLEYQAESDLPEIHNYARSTSFPAYDDDDATYETMLTGDELTSCIQDENSCHVRFASALHLEVIIIIPSVDDYSQAEKHNCWYTEEETNKRFLKRLKTIERLRSGKQPKKGHTYRGLEGRTIQGALLQRATIAECIDAVMDEQDIQWLSFTEDHGKLALASLQVSGPSKEYAWELAQLDALEARDDVDDEDSSETGSESSPAHNGDARKTCSRKKENRNQTSEKVKKNTGVNRKITAPLSTKLPSNKGVGSRRVTAPAKLSSSRSSSHRHL